LPPRREFLVDQITTVLRRNIGAGRWRGWLPAERVLCKVFNISRLALRVALQQLVSARELILIPRRDYLLHSPAHYQVNLELLARMLFRCLLRVVGGATRPDERHWVVPEYVAGSSIAPIRAERRK
jgi:DNA-binding GntR family transcriptional regulator